MSELESLNKDHCLIYRMLYRYCPLGKNTFNPIQDGGRGQKDPPPPTRFSSVTSANVGISPQIFLTLLTLLPHWCKISNSYLMPVPNYWSWTKTTPQKKQFFWSNPYKIEVMITSFTEMLELPNFGHMTTFTL